jgi:hypothetical protein
MRRSTDSRQDPSLGEQARRMPIILNTIARTREEMQCLAESIAHISGTGGTEIGLSLRIDLEASDPSVVEKVRELTRQYPA